MNLDNEAILDALRAPIQTKTRQGQGNQTQTYVPHQAVTKRLNQVFGLNWNLEIVREIITSDQVAVIVRLHYPTADGMSYKDGVAGKKLMGNYDLGNMLKSSVSLAIVKAASLLGIKVADQDDEATDEQKEIIKKAYKRLGRKTPSEEKLGKLTVGEANITIDDLAEEIESLMKE